MAHFWKKILWPSFLFLKILFILFLEKGRGGEREGEKHQCMVASHTPPPRNVACHNMYPRLGIELATLWLAGRHSIHWATPARAGMKSLTHFVRLLVSFVVIVNRIFKIQLLCLPQCNRIKLPSYNSLLKMDIKLLTSLILFVDSLMFLSRKLCNYWTLTIYFHF